MTRAHGVSFDRVADHYDQTRGGMARARIQAEAIVGLLPLPGPLLEVGVGTGLVAAAVREQGRDVVGVDLSPAMLARAARRLPGRVAVGSALRLPVATGSVAGCYLVHVLHLVADAAQALTEAARVLREGGVLVASANVTRPPDSDVAQVLHDMRRESGTRRQVFGERELLAAAGAAGLHLVRRVDVAQIYQGNSPRDAADRIGGGRCRGCGRSTTRCGNGSPTRHWPASPRCPTRTGRGRPAGCSY